jgi:NADH-quinone oxidoreductase subunit G
MPKIKIDGEIYDIQEGQNLLHAALAHGVDIPYFCWHPSLGSVGACRQCAVQHMKDDQDTQGRLVMACMTPATEGSCFSVKHPEAKQFRENVIEWLMTNHPHDCPVCDEGGECHLQDMTVMSGHNYRKYEFKKRTHKNQYLGPLINHEMNRCIACYRCVRYYRDYTGGTDLNSFASANRVYFGRAEDGVLESEFSGNLVEVCPTGVFTDKTFKKHYTRKWDLQTSPAVCTHCSLGCNISPGERYGMLKRVQNRFNHDINGHFICDRGRFGYEFVNAETRLKKPLIKQEVASVENAVNEVKKILKNAQGIIGIGSGRSSLENNFALKSLVGKERFFSGLPEQEHKIHASITQASVQGLFQVPTLKEIEQSDMVLVIGEDVLNTGARMALALRQAALSKPKSEAMQTGIPHWNDAAIRNAIQNQKGPFYVANVSETSLDDLATMSFYGETSELSQLAYGLSCLLDSSLPKLENIPNTVSTFLAKIHQDLVAAKHPVIISGSSLKSQELTNELIRLATIAKQKNPATTFSYIVPEANSMGLALLEPQSLEQAIDLVGKKQADTLVLLENDLFRHYYAQDIERFFKSFKHIILIDYISHHSQRFADVILPSASFAEGTGSLISQEGRVQRSYKVYSSSETILEGWKWMKHISSVFPDSPLHDCEQLDTLFKKLCDSNALFKGLYERMPLAKMRFTGLKVARGTPNATGRTSMFAHLNVHESRPPQDLDSPFSHTMEGYSGQRPSALTSFYWKPGWNSVQSLSQYQDQPGGHWKDESDTGVRLFQYRPEQTSQQLPPSQKTWKKFNHDLNDLTKKSLVPLYHLFGSEELSSSAEELKKRFVNPYVAMNKKDFEQLNEQSKQASQLQFELQGRTMKLPIKIKEGLPEGCVGLPIGLPDFLWFAPGDKITITQK